LFEAAEAVGDPARVVLNVKFTAPSGRVRRRGAFWDGGASWRVRFMPDEEGVWSYETLSEPAVKGLGGQRGRLAVTRTGQGNRFLEHGVVRVSQNGRYFEHADGTPFFWLADTAWNGALLSTAADWRRYLGDRLAKRFTAVQFVTTHWRTAPTNLEGQTAYSGREEITIRPEFFVRLDERIDAVNEQGLLAAPVLLWTLGAEAISPGQLPEEQAVRLACYLVARYGAHHVIWFLGGDGRYSGEHADRWKRIGRAVFRDEDHAPVFHHPQGRQWPWDEYRDAAWLSALGYQSGHGDSDETLAWLHSGPPATQWRVEPVRPVINLEPNYENHVAYHSKEPHSAYNVRRAAYWSLLVSPTAGVTYGGHGIWSWQTEPGLPRDHERTGVAPAWHEALSYDGAAHMAHLADFFSSLPWWTLQPAPELLAAQPGEQDPKRFIAAARSEEGSIGVLYLPMGGDVSLGDAAGFKLGEWFDPRTAERRPAVGRAGRYQAPDRQDWVLLLRR
jgi:hypothetical protein